MVRWFNLYADGTLGLAWWSRTSAEKASAGDKDVVARIRVTPKPDATAA